MDNDQDQDHQAKRRRDFIRTHHPDRGGDPATFIAGLQSFAADRNRDPGLDFELDGEPLPPVFIVKRLCWPLRLVIALARHIRPSQERPRVH